MRNLTRKAKTYLAIVYLAGILAAVAATLVPFPHPRAPGWEWVLFLALAAATGGKKIRLLRDQGTDGVGSMSLGFVITFMAMLRLGCSGAVAVGSVGCLSSCLFPKRQPAHQLLFNVALVALEALLAGIVFLALNGRTPELNVAHSCPAVVFSCLTYFVVATGGVAIIIALCTDQGAWKLWEETFLWTAPGYFVGAGVSMLALLVFGHHLGAVLVSIAPISYLTYRSYAIYTTRVEEKQQHIEALQINQAQLADLYLAITQSLALAIDAKDQSTHQHVLRVQRYAVAMARQMGVAGADMEALSTAALLHDIGNLGVPENILRKPGRLNDEEFAAIKKHPEIGTAILARVPFPWPVLPVIKHHHERWDGTGYPDRLQGETIPLTARILAVADVYDVLTSARSYREARTHTEALEIIAQGAGTHFDPAVVTAFRQVIDGIHSEMAGSELDPFLISSSASAPMGHEVDEAVRDIHRISAELWALYEVSQSLSTGLGVQETLDVLARKMEDILPGTTCVFLVPEEQGEQGEGLVVRSAAGPDSELFHGARATRAGRSSSVVRERCSYRGPNDPHDLEGTVLGAAASVSIQSALLVPIVYEEGALGAINLYHHRPDAFGAYEQQLVEKIAHRAASTMHKAIEFDRTRNQAFTDPLTGLYNVRYVKEHVEERCRAASLRAATLHDPDPALEAQNSFALLCLDMDQFKPINDSFGHQAGDQVLRNLARIFRATVRERDVVARYGGDEFLIVLDGAGAVQTEAVVKRLQEAVEGFDPGLLHPALGALRLGVSIGSACFPQDGQDWTTLLAASDVGMYAQKTERKGVVLDAA